MAANDLRLFYPSEEQQREKMANTACTRPLGEHQDYRGGTAARRDCVRVFRQFAWLGVGSSKMALSPPAHQRVTPTVRRLPSKIMPSVFEYFISGNGHVISKETIWRLNGYIPRKT
jgi:hypothetical protein